MRVVGEVVVIVTERGGGTDRDGNWTPPTRVETEVPGCVIVPKGDALQQGDGYMLASKEISVLAPVFLDNAIGIGAELRIRGQIYEVSGPVFDHRSPFGTSRGGTEIPAVWKEVA